MRECPECGFPLEEFGMRQCPKCDGFAPGEVRKGILEVDVAHAGETWEQAREKILDALDQALAGGFRGLKIVHGYGSTSGQSVIGPRATAYLRHLAGEVDGRYAADRRNRGASVLWLNR
ncbi:MAG: Smr/MutS family protein [Akkermansiaceae bacterium]